MKNRIVGGHVPSAKIVGERRYSIISDYLGTPVEAYDEEGKRIWKRELDIYGRVRIEQGEVGLVPFLYQGQYLDTETGLAYNRFRFSSPETGAYISQGSIHLGVGYPPIRIRTRCKRVSVSLGIAHLISCRRFTRKYLTNRRLLLLIVIRIILYGWVTNLQRQSDWR